MKNHIKKTLWVVLGLAVLAFVYYAISPLFINIKLDEAVPIINVPADPENKEKVATIVDTPTHPASGVVRVIKTEGKTFIRYENLKTINGPDLFVYLATDLEATEFVNLGKVKATEGNVNYEVPAGVRVEDYRYVLIWCRAFGVLFNFAQISI